MFCVQCEQTIRTPSANGCAYTQGMCGKTAETSDLQDLLVAVLHSLSAWAVCARKQGFIDHEVDSFAPRAFFATLTNVNFDSQRIVAYVHQALAYRDRLTTHCLAQQAELKLDHPLAYLQVIATSLAGLQEEARQYALNLDKADVGEDI